MPNALLHQTAVVSSLVTSSFALWRGSLVVRAAPQPPLPLVLYDMEACPYCRRVREAFTALHLDVEIRPCPKNGLRFRPEAIALGMRVTFAVAVALILWFRAELHRRLVAGTLPVPPQPGGA